MSKISDNLWEKTELQAMGLSIDESDLYLLLIKSGPLSVLSASSQLDIPRTTIYRIYQELTEKGLVLPSDGRRGLKLQALPPSVFEELLHQRQADIDAHRQSLPALLGALTNMAGGNLLGSRVVYYQGVEGLKQVNLNSLEAQDEVLVYGVVQMSAFMSDESAEEIRAEIARRQIKTRQLTHLRTFSAWTKTDFPKFLEFRYVDPAELRMQFEMLIYNDVLCAYSYSDGEAFCVEIHSPDLVGMQKQLFNFVWARAQPMRRAGPGGAMRLS